MMKRSIPYLVLALIIACAIIVVSCDDDDSVVHVTGIAVDPQTVALSIGDEVSLTATITPADASNTAVTWSSSDATVATVDNEGKVTALAGGTATITATASDTNEQATCLVTVAIPVTGITLNTETLTMLTGDETTLTATITPATASNPAIMWTSSNTDVVTVDETGKLTAVASGEATITVTATGTSVSAACSVSVLTSLTLDFAKLALSLDESFIFYAPADDLSLTWSTSDESVASVDENGQVTPHAEGTATITVTSSNPDQTATCEVIVVESFLSYAGSTVATGFIPVYVTKTDGKYVISAASKGSDDLTITIPEELMGTEFTMTENNGWAFRYFHDYTDEFTGAGEPGQMNDVQSGTAYAFLMGTSRVLFKFNIELSGGIIVSAAYAGEIEFNVD